MSEFLLVLVPHDESGMEIGVEEYASATAQQEALVAAQASGAWRDVIGLYRHPGSSPLANIWWAGPSTIYERRFYREQGPAA